MGMTIAKAFEPKSDQQNAENFISGPRTIKIRDVVITGGEQPVSIFFEGDDNKPWKPCKTAGRCLVAVWGDDERKWIGLSCTIYNDPKATWAGVAVGGIRVSHMEGLTSPRSLMLSRAKGKREATVIKPLVLEHTPEQPAELPPIDRDALFQDARDNAELGADGMRKWWSQQSKESQTALREILDELKEIAAKSDGVADD